MRRFAFPDRLRLRSRPEFDRVFQKCVRSTDHLFTVLARNNNKQHPRLGLVVSAKTAGNAVNRHRIKRKVRESFRLSRYDLPAADLVVITRPGVRNRSADEITSSLQQHWQRITGLCA